MRSEERCWLVKGQAEIHENEISKLAASAGLKPLVARVCLSRGLNDAESVKSFLSPKLDSLTDPFRIRDMDRAAERVAQAKRAGERVRVFADYDVDGTCGASILTWFFRDIGLVFDCMQPNRFKDGYGLNPRAVEAAAEAGVRVLITVDCGITSFEATRLARAKGIDLIIVDHHQIDPEQGLPEALAVVNPQRSDCESGLKQLCGAALAFYLALAIRSKGRADGWFSGHSEPQMRTHLDLVVLATAADHVPLIGDNRILARHGMEVLKHTSKPGLRAMLESAGLNAREDLSPGHLGFVLGPRINASGRLKTASQALSLLTTQDVGEAAALALELDSLNRERMSIQDAIWEAVREQVAQGIEVGKYAHGVVVADPSWHEGVVGIVATRVTEAFHRPAIVIAIRDGIGKGSVRSYRGHNVLEALRTCSEYLLGFGGHAFAAGLSIEPGRVAAFAEAFDRVLAQASPVTGAEPLWTEGVCRIEDLDRATLEELEAFAPFGPGNPEPVFEIEAEVRQHRVLKEKHLKLSLSPVGASHLIDAIWFHAFDRGSGGSVGPGSIGRVAAVPELNRFRGRVTPSLRVRDWKENG